MGFLDWNDGASVLSTRSSHRRHRSSRSHKKRRSRSRSRSSSPDRGRSFAGSIFGGDRYGKHNSSRASFFGLGGGNNSRSSFFGNSRSSYYKRSPRQGFIQKTYKQLKRLLRDLVHWAKRHPWKVFFLVIMPLITGGALTALLARFGLRIPPAIERMLGVASKAATGDSSGLVGEAVRMASGFGGNTSVRMERDTRSFSGGRGDDSWGSGLADMAKKWM
ncbi:hypothetical protein NW754_006517 [Fusarium falciforme]|uniref:Uncharacterized protein n=3 Tax=Fusarium solani species complex TaxID=232080 RepID=A0A9W8RKI1_9HYPO|nr:hypothetical protein NCS57_00596300 [Fusarium keratoplasticum]XP_053007047.1 Hypothetical protein NCS54_00557500 [Fusarium falciforme]UPK90456.1 hypothetical protein LCI18_001391 [Fusarium solani-melongenae]KAI8671221.1 hypothetical protein NCS57_00596300 [Fusarium keratoplasticum]KAI8678452.1 hypothetical protein NCS55_00565800 [Fusarium keratoplasticum]KAJ4170380.1 hypothetical protein NW754_006517 [Fusarium falciforme]KAJ4197811.1 hypothetical protein NW755_000507 [Fusarium falciforme]